MAFGGCTPPLGAGETRRSKRRCQCTKSSEAAAVLRIVKDYTELHRFHKQRT